VFGVFVVVVLFVFFVIVILICVELFGYFFVDVVSVFIVLVVFIFGVEVYVDGRLSFVFVFFCGMMCSATFVLVSAMTMS